MAFIIPLIFDLDDYIFMVLRFLFEILLMQDASLSEFYFVA